MARGLLRHLPVLVLLLASLALLTNPQGEGGSLKFGFASSHVKGDASEIVLPCLTVCAASRILSGVM
jgi:hypothetical protein